jgi:hypothetical protein
MLGANVPTTIFCLMAFLISYQSSSWLSVIIGIPELMFCLFELIGLTSSPAKVHAAVNICRCQNINIFVPLFG